MKELLTYLTKSLVKFPDDVVVKEEATAEEGLVKFSLHVNPEDMGRVIGRNGKTARAIRLIVSARAAMENKRSRVDIEDEHETGA